MFAIVEIYGKQYKVAKGDKVLVNSKIDVAEGKTIKFDSVKAVSDKDKNIFEIDEKEAIELIIEKREIDANKEINIFEESGVKVLNGPYGPYVTDGKKNVRVPKDTDPKSLSEEVCLEMLKNAPKRRARFRRRKS